MLNRPRLEEAVRRRMAWNPVTSILGPRQCGKTTLARMVAAGTRSHYFDLEKASDFRRLEDPERALGGLRGLVVLDEIQRRPELFNHLRVLSDRRPLPCRFLILGSAAPEMVKGVSESLAGRVGFVGMGAFLLGETGMAGMDRLWLRGGFPRSFLAKGEEQSREWREDLIQTYLERDIPQLGHLIPPHTLRRFWAMVAHYHGQTWNASEIAGSLGFSHPTARRYLDLLTGTYMVRQLRPWFLNVKSGIVKSPKVYIRDSGIMHSLLGIKSRDELESHPKLGASWEGFGIEQVLAVTGERDAFFWATHGGAEIDLVIGSGARRWGFEFKCTSAPAMTKSIGNALKELGLEHIWVVYPGNDSYPLRDKVSALAIKDLQKAIGIVTRLRGRRR